MIGCKILGHLIFYKKFKSKSDFLEKILFKIWFSIEKFFLRTNLVLPVYFWNSRFLKKHETENFVPFTEYLDSKSDFLEKNFSSKSDFFEKFLPKSEIFKNLVLQNLFSSGKKFEIRPYKKFWFETWRLSKFQDQSVFSQKINSKTKI